MTPRLREQRPSGAREPALRPRVWLAGLIRTPRSRNHEHLDLNNLTVASILALAATVSVARAEYATGYGPNPKLPPPDQSLVPTIEVAPAKEWPAGTTPTPAQGLEVKAFADGLDHPRWLYVLPNGDVLVAETNAPERPEDGKGIMDWVKGLFMSRAGAKTKSANRITLLARRGRRRRGGAQNAVPHGPALAVRHGA